MNKHIRTVTGIATACLVVIGGIGCAQSRSDASTASARAATPATTTARVDSAAATRPDVTPSGSDMPRSSTSAMGSTGTMGASTPYTAPAPSTATTASTPAPTTSATMTTTTDGSEMRAPRSDRN